MTDNRLTSRGRGGARAARLVACAVIAAAASGCVDAFGGSKIEILFSNAVPLPGAGELGAPPDGTHFELYAVQGGLPVHIMDMQLEPVVQANHPCFIELDRDIPLTNVSADGLHASQWYQYALDLYDADGVITDEEAGFLADALRRVSRNIPDLEANVVAVTATPFGRAVEGGLSAPVVAERLAAVPPPGDTDDASNRTRAELCRELFADVPELYVGTDRLITAPLNGLFFGVADGQDPRSGGFIGGASLDLPARLDSFEALRLNWQFDDPADPRAEALGQSPTGYHFMAGVPEHRVRGVINVHLENNDFGSTSADLAIFTDLDEDSTGF